MPITTIETGLYEGLLVSELLSRSLDRLKQKARNYDRYTKQSIMNALNDTQVEVARRKKLLHSFAIVEMKAGYSQYKPPTQMILPEKAFFYQSTSSYWELTEKTRIWMDKYKSGWRQRDTASQGDPLFLFPGDNYGNMRKLGVYPTPDTDGTAYTANLDTGIFASSSGMTTTGNITGQNNTASATVCTDSDGTDMAGAGVTVGMMAVNVTDGSSGQISAVSGATFTVTLTGGTADTWAVGDSYNVLAGEYGVVTKWGSAEEYLFTAEIGGMVDVTALTGNVYLEFVRRPLKLSYDGQYPEIPPDLHQYLPENVPYILKRNAPRGSADNNEAIIARQAFQEGIDSFVSLEDQMEDDCVMNYN